jgi:hypothetical protein
MTGWGKVKAGAQYAGISVRTFRDWLKHGLKYSQLPSGTILVRFSDIDSFLESFSVNHNEIDQIVDSVCRDLSLSN